MTDCTCEACLPHDFAMPRMILCALCGNKRCPHATDHRNACTNSNEPGQKGSSYENAPKPGDPWPAAAQEPPAPDDAADWIVVLRDRHPISAEQRELIAALIAQQRAEIAELTRERDEAVEWNAGGWVERATRAEQSLQAARAAIIEAAEEITILRARVADLEKSNGL